MNSMRPVEYDSAKVSNGSYVAPDTKPTPQVEKCDIADLLNELRYLVREPSVIGAEDAFFRVLRRELEECGIKVIRYEGLLVAQGSKPDSLYLSAHIDRHGLLCTGPNEFQYAAFVAGNRSDLTGDSVSEQFMEVIKDRFNGQRVQAHTPYAGSYLGQGIITRSYICPGRKNLIFELDGLEFLQPGTPVSFVDRLAVKDGFVSAQLDNVVSVAMLIHLIRRGFQGTAMFTAGEEAGRSWRYVAEYFRRDSLTTDRLIVLDTSPFPSVEEATQAEVVLRHHDAGAQFSPTMTSRLESRCEELGIRTIFKDDYVRKLNANREKPLSYGRTELGRLITASDGLINGTTLQLPTTGYHTARETVAVESLAGMLQVLLAEMEES